MAGSTLAFSLRLVNKRVDARFRTRKRLASHTTWKDRLFTGCLVAAERTGSWHGEAARVLGPIDNRCGATEDWACSTP
jgi:hypothetical protein